MSRSRLAIALVLVLAVARTASARTIGGEREWAGSGLAGHFDAAVGAPDGPAGAASPCPGAAARPQGFAWVYAGTVHTDAGSRRVMWTTTVLGRRSAGGADLTLVRGFVRGLPWHDREPARLSLLVCVDGRVYEYRDLAEARVRQAFELWRPDLVARSDLLFEPPLREGRVFAQDPPREDALYGWQVELAPALPPLPRSCPGASSPRYRLTRRTLPDHEMLEWSEAGVSAYAYEHHGTTDRVALRLVRCRPGG